MTQETLNASQSTEKLRQGLLRSMNDLNERDECAKESRSALSHYI